MKLTQAWVSNAKGIPSPGNYCAAIFMKNGIVATSSPVVG
jgi:hypothetical protein